MCVLCTWICMQSCPCSIGRASLGLTMLEIGQVVSMVLVWSCFSCCSKLKGVLQGIDLHFYLVMNTAADSTAEIRLQPRWLPAPHTASHCQVVWLARCPQECQSVSTLYVMCFMLTWLAVSLGLGLTKGRACLVCSLLLLLCKKGCSTW